MPVAPPDYRVVASRNSKDAERKLQAAGPKGFKLPQYWSPKTKEFSCCSERPARRNDSIIE